MRTRLVILVLGVGLGLGALGIKRLVEIAKGTAKPSAPLAAPEHPANANRGAPK